MTAPGLDFNVSQELHSSLGQWRMRAGLVGAVGLILAAIGWFVSPDQFFRSYLWSYLVIVVSSAGCGAWLRLQCVTGGAWGMVIRRRAEAAVRTFPLVALLFVPIAFGIPNLYPWAHPNLVAADEIL